MKIAYRLTKILLILVVVVYVLGLLFYPATMALFTTEGYGSWENFFNDLFYTFIYLTPFAAIIFIPILMLRSFLAYKLSYMSKRSFVNKTWLLTALEIIIGVALAIFIIMILNSNHGVLSSYTSTGRYLVSNGETSLIILDNSPIVMINDSDEDIFKGLTDGDLISITHSEIMESYPGQTRVYKLKKQSDGTIEDIPKDVLDNLRKMGWIGSD